MTIELTGAGGASKGIVVVPGDTFAVEVQLVLDGPVTAAQVSLQADTSGVFDLVEGSYNAGEWDTDMMAMPITSGGLDPVADSPIGSGTIDLVPVESGVSVLATATLQVDSEASPGAYTLQVTDVSAGDESFAEIPVEIGNGFLVVVEKDAGWPFPGCGLGTGFTAFGFAMVFPFLRYRQAN